MTTISDVLDVTLTGGKKIGGVAISATIEEIYSDNVTITEHPVEKGAPINDHAYVRPREVVMKCGWSNADYSALLGAASVSFDPTGANTMATGTYVDAIYSKLLKLQADRQPIDVTTTRRKYQNMLIQGLTVVTDQKTSSALMVTATLKQVIIVSTKAAKLPPRANQANPAATAETQSSGVKSATPAAPAPGGSVSPS
ncbi:phage baseplate protein [Burkholderia gladioli]|uniref:phage baseplate protein n=1 Tax=Burkholderia gladioli TaxID=28095 RepID=UPI002FE2177F